MATDDGIAGVTEQLEWRVRWESVYRGFDGPGDWWQEYPTEQEARAGYALGTSGEMTVYRAVALQHRSVVRTNWVTVMLS